jgi:ATP-dependent Lon protease
MLGAEMANIAKIRCEEKNFILSKKVPIESLRWTCPTDAFDFKSTQELEHLDSIVGQPRAIESIRLGAELKSKGYNIFVSGLSGTGRLSTVKSILEKVTSSCPITYDYCYVNNFSDPDAPRLIKLPRAKGKEFSKAMDDAISYLRQRLPKLFEEEGFQESRRKLVEEYQLKERDILHEFDESIRPYGFVRGQIETEQGIVQPEVFPVIDGKPIHIESIQEMTLQGQIAEEQAKELESLYDKFHNELYELGRKGIKLMQEFKKILFENDKAACSDIVESILFGVAKEFPIESVKVYVEETIKFILENLSIFVPSNQARQEDSGEEEVPAKPTDMFYLFSVNVILDNSETNAAPVIVETTPSYTNLFGAIERSYDSRGYWRTDFTKIKAGALLKADQGYLIVNASDLFNEPGAWAALKRVLLYDQIEIQPYEAYFQLSQLHLKPEPIDVSVKVIIIGGLTLYRLLYLYEKGFKKIFKINAQFDYEMERTEEMIENIAKFIAKICDDESLPHFAPDGVAAIVEWAVTHAGSQDRITLKFSDVADMVRESAFYDRKSTNTFIGRADVMEAMRQREFRNNLVDEKMKDYILKGSSMIDTDGERVGQINGLTVMDTGLFSFGKPARITAIISAGNSGIINIEREADLSGAIHNKGVLILSGILRSLFAKKKPMNLTASISFEQSYGGVDGDSATAAELFAILSAITELPIKQSIAITGSINQLGDVQPIGGVNEKLKGFYQICKERGLTGEQGALIPAQNVQDLMLEDDLVEDVKAGKFHIYSFARFEEGARIMMGLDAGEMNEKGDYPKDTIFGLAQAKIEELRKFSEDEESKKKSKKTKKDK